MLSSKEQERGERSELQKARNESQVAHLRRPSDVRPSAAPRLRGRCCGLAWQQQRRRQQPCLNTAQHSSRHTPLPAPTRAECVRRDIEGIAWERDAAGSRPLTWAVSCTARPRNRPIDCESELGNSAACDQDPGHQVTWRLKWQVLHIGS